MLYNPLLTFKSVNQAISASNRIQVLKLRQFEVSKKSPYLGTLGVWDRSVLRPSKHALLARGQTGSCRLCRRQSWDSVLFGFKTFLGGSHALLAMLAWGTLKVLHFKIHGGWAGFWREDPRAVTKKCFNKVLLGALWEMGFMSMNWKIHGKRGGVL